MLLGRGTYHVDMWTWGFIWTLDARRQHTVWGSFRLVAVPVLAYGQLSIIIPACRAWGHSHGEREEGVGRWMINRRVEPELRDRAFARVFVQSCDD